MKESPEFDLIAFLQALDQKKIAYLLIGRWAVAQHGAPVVTADYDFWVRPKDRAAWLRLLEHRFNAELPPKGERSKPMLSVYVGPDKIDCFFIRRIVNEEGVILTFDQVFSRAEKKRDPEADFTVCLPRIDDLIALKRFTPKDPLKRARNLEDIRYLLTLKKNRRRIRKKSRRS